MANQSTIFGSREVPWQLEGWGFSRLKTLKVNELKTLCAQRKIDVPEKARQKTCATALIQWKKDGQTSIPAKEDLVDDDDSESDDEESVIESVLALPVMAGPSSSKSIRPFGNFRKQATFLVRCLVGDGPHPKEVASLCSELWALLDRQAKDGWASDTHTISHPQRLKFQAYVSFRAEWVGNARRDHDYREALERGDTSFLKVLRQQVSEAWKEKAHKQRAQPGPPRAPASAAPRNTLLTQQTQPLGFKRSASTSTQPAAKAPRVGAAPAFIATPEDRTPLEKPHRVEQLARVCALVNDLRDEMLDKYKNLPMPASKVTAWFNADPARLKGTGIKPGDVSTDHIIPKAKGGHDHIYNYVIMPKAHNSYFNKWAAAEKDSYIGAQGTRIAEGFASFCKAKSEVPYSKFDHTNYL